MSELPADTPTLTPFANQPEEIEEFTVPSSSMSPQQARRVLGEWRYVWALMQSAIDRLHKTSLDMLGTKDDLTLEGLWRRKGQVEGLKIAQSFFIQAQQVLLAAKEDADAAQEGLSTDSAPPGFVDAVLHPKPPTPAE